MSLTSPATQFSAAVAGGSRAIRTFSGRSATHTVSPGLASEPDVTRKRPTPALAIVAAAGFASATFPSIRFTSPMKSATQRELGCS